MAWAPGGAELLARKKRIFLKRLGKYWGRRDPGGSPGGLHSRHTSLKPRTDVGKTRIERGWEPGRRKSSSQEKVPVIKVHKKHPHLGSQKAKQKKKKKKKNEST